MGLAHFKQAVGYRVLNSLVVRKIGPYEDILYWLRVPRGLAKEKKQPHQPCEAAKPSLASHPWGIYKASALLTAYKLAYTSSRLLGGLRSWTGMLVNEITFILFTLKIMLTKSLLLYLHADIVNKQLQTSRPKLLVQVLKQFLTKVVQP